MTREKKLRVKIFDEQGKYTREFLQLQFEWDSKLQQSGFKSIEHRNPDGSLSHHVSDNCIDVARKWRFDVQRYFELAGYWLWQDHGWSNLERALWEEHCTGKSNTKILEAARRFLRDEPKRMLAESQAESTISAPRASAKASMGSGYDHDE